MIRDMLMPFLPASRLTVPVTEVSNRQIIIVAGVKTDRQPEIRNADMLQVLLSPRGSENLVRSADRAARRDRPHPPRIPRDRPAPVPDSSKLHRRQQPSDG